MYLYNKAKQHQSLRYDLKEKVMQLRKVMSSPNIFSFATSELSQDAFICWFLS